MVIAWKKSIALAGILLLVACSGDKIGVDLEGDGSNTSSTERDGNLTIAEGTDSVKAFEDTAYKLTRENCKGCHNGEVSPSIADDDPKVAHAAVMDSGKVDLKDTGSSRLVLRLSQDNHNCWGDCEEDAEKMQAAIDRWAELLNDLSTTLRTYQTDDAILADIFTNPDDLPRGDLIFEAENGKVVAPMNESSDGDASGGTYLSVPNGAGEENVEVDSRAAGYARYRFDIKEDGDYYIFARVRAPSPADDSFYVLVDGGAPMSWALPIGNNWSWQGAHNDLMDPNASPVAVTLAAGRHVVEIRQREAGTEVDQIAITDSRSFSGGSSNYEPPVSQTLEFEIGRMVKARPDDLILKIDIDDFDGSSYIVSNPRVTSRLDYDVRFEGLQVLVNNQFEPTHSTYTGLDMTVDEGDHDLSTAAMILAKDKGAQSDEISLRFTKVSRD